MKKIFLLVCSLALVQYSCTTSKKVERVDANTQIDLSGRWNDTDSRLVSEEMMKDALGRAWLTDFSQTQTGKKPTVIVGIIKNKSHEHVNTETFTKDIEREFINSGKVKVVQAAEDREELRKERGDQQEFASKETAKQWGKEKGADFMLQGTVNSIVDGNGKEEVIYYQIDLELSSIESNETVWIGTKKIKKVVQK